MIAGPALQAWFDDPAAQQASHERTRAFGAAWKADPLRVALAERMSAATSAAERIAAIEPLLAEPGWAQALIGRLAAEMAADPLFEPPFRGLDGKAHDGLYLIEEPGAAVALTTISAVRLAALKTAALGPRAIAFSGETTLIRVIEPGDAVISLWSAEPAGADFDPATAPPCLPDGQVALTAGMRLEIDGTRRSYVIERASREVVLLQATVRGGGGPLLVEYSAETHRFLSMSATDGAASRSQLMAALLVAMRRRDAAPLLAAQAEDPRFFVRWQAARAMAALDPAAATPTLRRMADSDPQPAVRRAAAATLALLCPA